MIRGKDDTVDTERHSDLVRFVVTTDTSTVDQRAWPQLRQPLPKLRLLTDG